MAKRKLNAKEEALNALDKLRAGAGNLVSRGLSAYQKASPYIPFAPQVPTVQSAKQATQRQEAIINYIKPFYQGYTEPITSPPSQSSFRYQAGRTFAGMSPVSTGPINQIGQGIVRQVPRVVSRLQKYGKVTQPIYNRLGQVGQEIAQGLPERVRPAAELGFGLTFGGIQPTKPRPYSIKFHPEDEKVMQNFAAIVQTLGKKANKVNFGQLGKDAQNIVEYYFGKKFGTLSNNRIAQLFDYALARREGGIPIKPRGQLPMGLSTQETEGLAQQALKGKPSQPQGVIPKGLDLSKAKITKEFGFPGMKEITTEIPLDDIPKRSITTPEYRDYDVNLKMGKRITKPIIATIRDINDPNSPIEIVDGWHRWRQAVLNKDKTIPIKYIFQQAKGGIKLTPEQIKAKQKLPPVMFSTSKTIAEGRRPQAVLPKPQIMQTVESNLRGVSKPILQNQKQRPTMLAQQSVAQQAEKIIANNPRGAQVGKTLPDIIDSPEIDVKNKVNLLDYIRTPDRVLQKIGLGKEAMLLRKKYDDYLKDLPREIDKISQWANQVPRDSNIRIFKYLDGQNIPLNPVEQRVANEVKTYLSQWADKLKLPQDRRISQYITHIFEKDFIKKEFDPELAKLIQNKVAGSVYDPFLEQRLGKMGYVEDTWRALDAYVKRATRKFHMDQALSQVKEKAKGLELSQYNYVKSYIDRVNLRPTNIDNLLDNTIKSLVEYRFGQRPTAYLSRMGRQAVYRGTLGLNIGSALKNLTQGSNTYARLGEKYTLVGYINTIKSLLTGSGELEATGLLKQDLIQDRTLSATKKFIQGFDKALFSFFDLAERINRGGAYFGGKAKGLAQGMNEQQAIEYAKKITRDTQFTFGTIDTPVALQSDIAKTIAQLQTFSIKQAEFLGEMIKAKDVAGLIRYTLGSLAMIYSVGRLFGMELKDIIPSFRLGAPPTLGTPVEIAKSLIGKPDKYGNIPDIQERVENVGRTLIPYIPAGVQLRKTIGGLSAVDKGFSESRSGRIQYAIEKTPSAYLRAGLFGKRTLPEAKEYFNKKLQPLGEKQSETIRQEGYKGYKRLRDIQEKIKPFEITPEEKQQRQEKGQMLLNMLKTQGGSATSEYLRQAYQRGEITKEDIKKLIKDYRDEQLNQARGVTASDEYLKNQPIKVRARYVISQIKDKSPEERRAILIDFLKKRVVTKEVLREIVTNYGQ